MRNTKEFNYYAGITHGGLFHADEVFTTAAIRLMYDSEFPVERVFSVTKQEEGVFIYDIGMGEYDHHQAGGNGKRENGVPYASFGVFWRDFCIYSDFVFAEVDKNLVQCVDAIDNGVFPANDSYNVYSVSRVISMFNPNNQNDSAKVDDAFEDAVDLAMTILQHEISYAEIKEKDVEVVRSAINSTLDDILVLNQYARWQDVVLNSPECSNMKFVIFPSSRGGWCTQGIPVESRSRELRVPLLAEWGGRNAEDLQKMTGIETFNFCHTGLFLASSGTKEDARKVAQLAINGNEKSKSITSSFELAKGANKMRAF